LKEKGRKRGKHCKRKSSGLLPDSMEALISLFKDQFLSYKAGKIWTILMEEFRVAGRFN
jgi:hypothetical protein